MSPNLDAIALFPCLLVGSAAGLLVWWVLEALATEDLKQDREWRYDVSRINSLRRLDSVFRLTQPVIQFLARLNRAALNPAQREEMYREIQAAGLPRYWLPEEYFAKLELIALLLAPGYFYVSLRMLGPVGIFTALMLTGLTLWLLRRRLSGMARNRLMEIKRRMPFLLDLLTLLMEAGSSFLGALQQAVREFEGHPVAEEFGRVLADMNMGKARGEAFDNLRHRLSDDEINGIVGAIIQSEQLGTPLSHIFRTQADVLRVKRSQRAETVAGEAGVNMLLPGILVMAAAVLVILGPFMLNYLVSGLGF